MERRRAKVLEETPAASGSEFAGSEGIQVWAHMALGSTPAGQTQEGGGTAHVARGDATGQYRLGPDPLKAAALKHHITRPGHRRLRARTEPSQIGLVTNPGLYSLGTEQFGTLDTSVTVTVTATVTVTVTATATVTVYPAGTWEAPDTTCASVKSLPCLHTATTRSPKPLPLPSRGKEAETTTLLVVTIIMLPKSWSLKNIPVCEHLDMSSAMLVARRIMRRDLPNVHAIPMNQQLGEKLFARIEITHHYAVYSKARNLKSCQGNRSWWRVDKPHSVARQFFPTIKGLAQNQGSMQNLPDGHTLVSWGLIAEFSEFDQQGKTVLDVAFAETTTHETND
ncbi:uncharacterized protein MYCFIDRAFT_169986 [Pseudocercospora fijiensis CIRAD86]|uniref:Uncharacterized protein n=1 Tax=Pseudocercospora fijiensis (strain CIRAD86) TaxID=383855 RepID=N1Q708_PSEFD|nr:uncharacterized protein MYCFIDRAFT_169986 [Pseudocercospora fijiensis CIRAD86]EME88365.1 hypothetical protein MYCFIDRAFT_169986 [Pseudocercospora fijiensis CIRAD86]